MAADPSQNVNERLLPHIHLISTFRYAVMPNVTVQEVSKWLLNAPKIARDTAPFFWTYLDAPSDGTIMLTWQPLQRRDTVFSSDGYMWAGPENYYQHEVGNGLILEMFYARTGYRPSVESIALHSRKRFRLIPKGPLAPGAPQVDPSLWIVHYGPNEPGDRIAVQVMSNDPQQNALMQVRMQLQRGGQIARKEFMLADRGNWPHIPLPREGRGQAMYAQPPNARTLPQQMAYPAGPPQAHPPKRARTGAAGAQQHGVVAVPPIDAFDDEEDTSRGDMFDHMTPREVSTARYQRNHEWMEEILGSAYRIGQITHADLGLGLQGELSSITDGIFESAGVDANVKPPKKPVIGHLDPGLAEEFRKRVSSKMTAESAEMQRMKSRHDKLLAKFKSNSLIKHAEQDLRVSVEEIGPEFWRLEGRQEEGEDGTNRWSSKHLKKVDDIVASVESALDRHVQVVSDVMRIQEGGYQEPAPEPEPIPLPPAASAPDDTTVAGPASMSRQPSRAGSQNSGVMVAESDTDMGGTAASLLDQMHGTFSPNSTPVNSFPTPQAQLSGMPSTAATPVNVGPTSPQPAAPRAQPPAAVSKDIAMTDLEPTKQGAAAADQGTGSDDWVVVPKGGISPGPTTSTPSGTATASGLAAATAPGTGSQPPPDAAKPATSKPASATGTPAFDGDNNDYSSLGDIDSAADALASYDPPTVSGTPGNLGDDVDMGMGMEDSAFGDALHGIDEARGSAADTPAEGGL